MLWQRRSADAVILYAREPELGRVKTRLASTLGQAEALRFYNFLLSCQQDTIKGIGSDISVSVHYTGSHGKFLQGRRLHWVRQRSGDLGARMDASFEWGFRRAEHVVIWGSDIPYLHADHLRNMLRHLKTFDAAVIPALDGGYCAIGFRRIVYQNSVFAGIPWSTRYTLRYQLERITDAGLSLHLGEPLPDADTTKDLIRILDFAANSDDPVILARRDRLSDWLSAAGS